MSMLDTYNHTYIYPGLYPTIHGLPADTNDIREQAQRYVSLHEEGKLEELEAILYGNEEALNAIIAWLLFPENFQDPEKAACRWLLANSDLLRSADGVIETGFYGSVYCWHEDGVKTFLALGADPNKEVMPHRFVLDVCRNRIEYPLYGNNSDWFQSAVEKLEEAGAKTYLEHELLDRDIDPIVFDLMDTREPWAERLLGDLQALPYTEQTGWIALLKHCAVKSKTRSKTWNNKLSKLIEEVNAASLMTTIQTCLQLATGERPSLIFGDLSKLGASFQFSDACKPEHDLWGITKKNSIMLKGLIWVLSRCGEDVEDDLYNMAKAMYTKLHGIGIRNVLLANTSFAELLNIGSDKALLYAIRLKEEADNQPAIKKMSTLLDPYLKEKDVSMNILQLRLEAESWDDN